MSELRNRLFQLFVSAALVVLACPARALGQVERSTLPGVELVLVAERDTYAPLEPIVITYALRNATEEGITIPGSMSLNTSWVRLEYAGPNGKFERFGSGHYGYTLTDMIRLQPAERISFQVMMLTNPLGIAGATLLGRHNPYRGISILPFREPGQYSIRVRYPLERSDGDESSRKCLVSNTVVITVRGFRARERDAIESLPDLSDFIMAMGGAMIGSDKPEAKVDRDSASAVLRWERFILAYPDVSYSPYVKWHLAEIYSSGTERVAGDPARAKGLLKDLVDHSPRFIVDDAMLLLAKLEIKAGNLDEARVTVEKLVGQHPDSELIPEASRLRKGLAKGQRSLNEIYSH